jgi:hypothetical protein
VLNGFIPGFKRLFEADGAKVVALHVSTDYPWREIRDGLVGGKSNPEECEPGSIRRDAYEGKIRLDPSDALVNGQRNVCHSSATLLDGMRELSVWFDYQFEETILGKVLERRGVSRSQIQDLMLKYLPSISWAGRDYTFDKILSDVQHRIILDNLLGAGGRRNQVIAQHARRAGVEPDVIRNFDNLLNLIENGLRLQISGEEFFLGTLIERLVDDEHLNIFLETVGSMRSKLKCELSEDDPARCEILAEAYRIAASDLAFLACPAYGSQLEMPTIFHTKVSADLAEQSVNCAKRTQANFIKEVVTSKASGI